MPRFKLTVAYDGTRFHGWQKQEPPGSEPLRTAQGVLEQAVRETVRQPLEIVGASRTDAGVHAIGQVAAFSATTSIPVERLPLALNARLPDDIQVRHACIVHDRFNPIGDAQRKSYRYTIAHGGAAHTLPEQRSFPPLFDRHFVYYTVHGLDAMRMHAAAQHLIGTHDFASVAHTAHGRETSVRTIFGCKVVATGDDRLSIDVTGDGFLYNMVRIIAGTLVDVGRARFEPDDIPAILDARDRTRSGPTLPANGLCLRWIQYPGYDVPNRCSDASTTAGLMKRTEEGSNDD